MAFDVRNRHGSQLTLVRSPCGFGGRLLTQTFAVRYMPREESRSIVLAVTVKCLNLIVPPIMRGACLAEASDEEALGDGVGLMKGVDC